jgi:seryl-tRNA synthetase
MLDIQRLRDNPDAVRRAIQNKRTGDPALVDKILALDEARRVQVSELQAVQTQANEASRSIGGLMKAGKKDEAQQKIALGSQLKARAKELEEQTRATEADLQRALLDVPNVPHESVPVGSTEADNVVAAEIGEKPTFGFEALPHWELIDRHGLVDFERGARVTGGGFPFYLGKGARLQRALVAFFLDAAQEAGYTEIQPPLLVNADSATGTGNLPDKEDQMYEMPRDGFYLIPTAEIPVTNLHRGEMLAESDLPIRYAAYTPCFRREAGSYGKDVRGLNRLHQFDKVELVHFVKEEDGYDALERLREDAERIITRLGLPYRRLLMCTGDMGFTQAKKYDLEVWSAGQKRWLEVSSVSIFEDFQSRRADIRYRPEEGGKPKYVHTLNGSGLAVPRIVAALLENGQQEDGTIRLPEPLHSYTGFETIG